MGVVFSVFDHQKGLFQAFYGGQVKQLFAKNLDYQPILISSSKYLPHIILPKSAKFDTQPMFGYFL